MISRYKFFCIVMLVCLLQIARAETPPFDTKFGQLAMKHGAVTFDKKPLSAPLEEHGRKIDLSWIDIAGANDVSRVVSKQFVLFSFTTGDIPPYYHGFIVLDLRGEKPKFSNPLEVDSFYQWPDNHYVAYKNGKLYVGLYQAKSDDGVQSSSAIQFIYEAGRLAGLDAPWQGPKNPVKYVDPQNPGPCFNVANASDCLKEQRGEQK